ncbi:hypothetical protein TNIN_271471 [Trichonephila inaurata madagascariensis]|uniref:Uncharacterized protein n=1 Tax=Trichonephila inaurata madagascariensis TaxID=2747483 RepID=A0A8X6YH50_9ARAC|nr:hypothetical protein TNIN_271471 [Trichonephila inaurata madagascariensis]
MESKMNSGHPCRSIRFISLAPDRRLMTRERSSLIILCPHTSIVTGIDWEGGRPPHVVTRDVLPTRAVQWARRRAARVYLRTGGRRKNGEAALQCSLQ